MKIVAKSMALSAAVVMAATPAVADNDFLMLAAAMSAAVAVGVVGELAAPETITFGTVENTPFSATVGAGLYGSLDGHEDDTQYGMGRVELRFPEAFIGLRPILGVEVSAGGSIYAYGGGMIDVRIADRLVLSPSLAVGYFQPGDVRDLGSAIEFRSGLEAAYEFGGGTRIGVAYHHISNANIDDINPGTEIISLNLSLPFE